MNETLRQIAFDTIKGFAWWNYGLDEVDQTKSDDWAHALADEIVAAVESAVKQSARTQFGGGA